MSRDKKARELRRFGLMVGAIFAIIAIVPLLLRGDGPRGWALLIAGGLMTLGLVFPRALGPVYRVWMWVGHILGQFNTRLLLGLVYFLMMTPMGVVMRLMGRDPLDRQLKDRPSYWVARKRQPDPKGAMERRF